MKVRQSPENQEKRAGRPHGHAARPCCRPRANARLAQPCTPRPVQSRNFSDYLHWLVLGVGPLAGFLRGPIRVRLAFIDSLRLG